jgi:uncharacterized Zn-finger protein
LRAHLRAHDNYRPYVCDYKECRKAFTRTDELKRHKRIHIDDRSYSCDVCQKRFLRSDHLSKHMQVHQKPEEKKLVLTVDPFDPQTILRSNKKVPPNAISILMAKKELNERNLLASAAESVPEMQEMLNSNENTTSIQDLDLESSSKNQDMKVDIQSVAQNHILV